MISISRVSDINLQSHQSEGNLNLLDAIMDTQTLDGSDNDCNLSTSNGNIIGRRSPIILNSNVVERRSEKPHQNLSPYSNNSSYSKQFLKSSELQYSKRNYERWNMCVSLKVNLAKPYCFKRYLISIVCHNVVFHI